LNCKKGGSEGQFFAILCGRLLWTEPCFFDVFLVNFLLIRSHQA